MGCHVCDHLHARGIDHAGGGHAADGQPSEIDCKDDYHDHAQPEGRHGVGNQRKTQSTYVQF